jgi:hypothetical protein
MLLLMLLMVLLVLMLLVLVLGVESCRVKHVWRGLLMKGLVRPYTIGRLRHSTHRWSRGSSCAHRRTGIVLPALVRVVVGKARVRVRIPRYPELEPFGLRRHRCSRLKAHLWSSGVHLTLTLGRNEKALVEAGCRVRAGTKLIGILDKHANFAQMFRLETFPQHPAGLRLPRQTVSFGLRPL